MPRTKGDVRKRKRRAARASTTRKRTKRKKQGKLRLERFGKLRAQKGAPKRPLAVGFSRRRRARGRLQRRAGKKR